MPAHSGAAQVEAAGDNTCVRTATGEVYCWGANTQGTCGQGHQADIGVSLGEISALAPVSLGAGLLASDVASGSSNTCVMFTDGTWTCCGSNAGGANANHIVLGAWGDNTAELGDTLSARSLPSGAVAWQVELGFQGGCAVGTCGTLRRWGDRGTHPARIAAGRCPSGSDREVRGPVRRSSITLAASCDGNSAGQAGVGTATAPRTPSAAIGLPAGLTVTHGGARP